jgi:putative ABC transport system substrate-binding protein
MFSFRLRYLKVARLIGLVCLSFLLVVSTVVATNNQNQSLDDAAQTVTVNPADYLKATDFEPIYEDIDAEEGLPDLEWFSLNPEVYLHWHVVPVPGNPSTLVVKPNWVKDDAEKKSILILIPKRSDVYGVAVSTTLNIFKQKNIAADFTIVNYGTIEPYGLALLDKAKQDNIDLIFSVGSVSTEFIQAHFVGEKIPVVTSASKDPVLLDQTSSYDRGSGTNVAYTSISPPFGTLRTYLLELKPNLENIAILYAEKNTSAVKTQMEPMAKIAGELGINTFKVGVVDRDNARAELVDLIPKAVSDMRESDTDGNPDNNLENSIFFITGSTSVYREIATINEYGGGVMSVATLPDVVQEGDDSAVLSIGAQMQNVANLATLYGTKIISGEVEPGELEVGIVSPPDIAISFRRLKATGNKIPFSFFELASFIYNYEGETVRALGQNVAN